MIRMTLLLDTTYMHVLLYSIALCIICEPFCYAINITFFSADHAVLCYNGYSCDWYSIHDIHCCLYADCLSLATILLHQNRSKYQAFGSTRLSLTNSRNEALIIFLFSSQSHLLSSVHYSSRSTYHSLLLHAVFINGSVP